MKSKNFGAEKKMDEPVTEAWEQDSLLTNPVGEPCYIWPNQPRIDGSVVTEVWEQNSILTNPVGEQGILPEAENLWEVKSQTNPAEALIFSCLKKEDSFTQVGLLGNEDNQVQDLIFRFRRLFSIPYRESLANSLLTLFNDAKEEDPTSLGITAGSLRNLYNLLQLHANLKCPIISLTPDYNIYASWRREQNRVFSVHFLPNGDTRFVILKPNGSYPGRQICLSGLVTTDILMEMVAVKPYDVSWISE